MLDPVVGLRIMPDNLPGGSMVNRVRHTRSPRLKTDAGLPFSSRCLSIPKAPQLRGFFLPGVRR
ncbi:pyrBI operon leader peptide [Pseudenterobacter timonensis]|uniref:pyrBI operon leader peptide n=1 Tax=Pseudenterobacter timonensis TaxID=1755099 RepID=UPI00093D1F46|nr:pyrBI operon leader peptide [Pseudenterobacter timonensis]